jgi:hypothetical protein
MFGGTRVKTPAEKFPLVADDARYASAMARSFFDEMVYRKANKRDHFYAMDMAIYWQEKAAEAYLEMKQVMEAVE